MGSRWLFACVLVVLTLGGTFFCSREHRGRGAAAGSAPRLELAEDPVPVAVSSPGQPHDGTSASSPEATPARVPARVERPEPPRSPEASGGRLHGRLVSDHGYDWTGFSVGIEPESAPAGGEPEELIRRAVRERSWHDQVAKTGTFELGPVPPGLATVYLYPPTRPPVRILSNREGLVRMTSPSQPLRLESYDDWNLRQGIAQVTIVEGITLERDFEVAELLGSLVVEVWVNEVPTAGLLVELQRDLGGNIAGATDVQGRFGPLPVLSGAWTLQVSGPNGTWRHQHPGGVQVGPSAERHALVQIEVVTARVHFLDRATGERLALRKIQLISLAGAPSIETDADGGATLSLTPGSYGLRLLPTQGASRRAEVAELFWTRQGPRDAFVFLRPGESR